MKITPEMIKEERQRMDIERELFGRWLSVGTGESQAFWKKQRPPLIKRTLSKLSRIAHNG